MPNPRPSLPPAETEPAFTSPQAVPIHITFQSPLQNTVFFSYFEVDLK